MKGNDVETKFMSFSEGMQDKFGKLKYIAPVKVGSIVVAYVAQYEERGFQITVQDIENLSYADLKRLILKS